MYAKIQNNTLQQYPYTLAQMRIDNPNTSFGIALSDDTLAGFGVVRVTQEAQPAFDPLTNVCEPTAPMLSGNAWTQGWTVTPLSPEQIAANAAVAMQTTITAFDTALTAHLDATAHAKRYDNRISCAVRAGYAGPFQAEGSAFASWMDGCNAAAYAMLAAVQAGTEPMPASPAAFIATLPVMVWPT